VAFLDCRAYALCQDEASGLREEVGGLRRTVGRLEELKAGLTKDLEVW